MDTLLTGQELAERLGCSYRTMLRWVKQGVVPPGIRIGRRAMRWRESDISDWIESRTPAGVFHDA